MTEMSTPEDEELIAQVYTQALRAQSDSRELDVPTMMVYEIETLLQEVNSGASFEQYFRWASLAEISQVVRRLESLGLSEVAELTRKAIVVAFPGGLPRSDEEKSDLTDWTEDQEERLRLPADEFTPFNGRITNALAAFYRKGQEGSHV